MALTLWILDKSAHVRLASGSPLPAEADPARLAICEMGMLEWLYSAKSPETTTPSSVSCAKHSPSRSPH